MFQEKIKAALIHFLVTVIFTFAGVCFVNYFWFPYGTLEFLKGQELFFIAVICDVVLGPLLSFVIFSSKKSRKELISDYAVIAFVQIAALAYGLYAIGQNRLQFLVFTVDRYEAVSAGELTRQDLLKAQEAKWRDPGYFGAKIVGVIPPLPTDTNYLNSVIAGIDGRDIQFSPEKYVDLLTVMKDVEKKIRPLSDFSADTREKITRFIPQSIPQEKIGWLPLSHDRIFWTILVYKDTGLPIRAIPLDPYGLK